MSAEVVPEGEVLLDRFVVRSATGQGSATFVHAHDRLLERPARVWLLTGTEVLERRAEVARTLASVQHPCLSPLHLAASAETSVGPAVLAAFRGHRGDNLRSVQDGKPSGADTTVDVIDQVAAAVTAVHQAGQSLGNLAATSVVRDLDGAIYLLDPMVAAIGHHGPAGAGPVHQQRDLGALVALVIELLTGTPVPSERRLPRTLPRLSADRPVLAELDRVLADAVRPDRPPPQPSHLAERVRDALVAVL